MVFSQKVSLLIKNLYLSKGFGPQRLLILVNFQTTVGSIKTLLNKIRLTGTTNRQKGSGKTHSTQMSKNDEDIEELVLSQEDKPKTHHSVHMIAQETGGRPRLSVGRIIHRDLRLKCTKRQWAQLFPENRLPCLTCCKQLLKKYSEHVVDMIWFSDQKIFMVPPHQIHKMAVCVHHSGQKKQNIAPSCLLHTQFIFGKSVMCSVSVSKMGITDLIFVNPGEKS